MVDQDDVEEADVGSRRAEGQGILHLVAGGPHSLSHCLMYQEDVHVLEYQLEAVLYCLD